MLRDVDPALLGDVFYSRLFIEHPSLRSLFKSSMEEQYKKLIDTISVLVARLEHLDELTADIQALAQRHVAYGVKPEYYDAVGSALLWTLQKGLGRDWTPAAEEAWTRCYQILSETMLSGASTVSSMAD